MKIIDADKRYMYPNEELMREWFDEFNTRFFEGKLPLIQLCVMSGEKHTIGYFHDPGKTKPIGFHPEDCFISLNDRFFMSEDEWRETIVHEMVHYYVYMVYGASVKAHGKEFKAVAKRINAISEFNIDTYSRGKNFRPKPSIIEHWGENFDKEIILGNYKEIILEQFLDDEMNEIIPIERMAIDHCFSFRTKRQYIPEIIDNLRNMRGEIQWFQVDECSQKLFLLPITTAVPSFKRDEIYDYFFEEKNFLEDFGPIKWTLLGTTEFSDDGVQGFIPGRRKEDFRQQYFRDAKEIGRLAAEMLVKRYIAHPRWFTSTIHGTYDAKPACGEYTVLVDSRFNPLVAMTPKKILINPVHSEIMMEHIKKGETESLANEISRVILSRQ